MIIDGLRSERRNDRARVAATVRWENSDRPTQEIYFETDAAFAKDLTCNPDAFVVGCVIPAFHYGEKRILIDAEICPELRDGLTTVITVMRHWYHDPHKQLLQIEAKTRKTLLNPFKTDRTGVFLSGGLDSFAALRANRVNFPAGHPGSFKDALVVYGFHWQEPDTFKQVLDSLAVVAKEVGIIPIGISTNLLTAIQGWELWADMLISGGFAAVGHCFANRLTTVALASAGFCFPKRLNPHGSHPLIDPTYSSSDLRIHQEGSGLSRLEKIRLIADWDFALKNLRVCNNTEKIHSAALNCGNCEKCIRTMLGFEALGMLDKVPVFPAPTVSVDQIRPLHLNHISVRYYHELMVPLAKQGRKDLVSVITEKINEFERSERLMRWKSQLKQFDRLYLDSRLLRLNRRLLGRRDVTSQETRCEVNLRVRG
jgi:hypothetical protein